jgi:hypothetical protein
VIGIRRRSIMGFTNVTEAPPVVELSDLILDSQPDLLEDDEHLHDGVRTLLAADATDDESVDEDDDEEEDAEDEDDDENVETEDDELDPEAEDDDTDSERS